MKQCRTYPDTNIESDHNPVIAKMNSKIKKIKKSIRNSN